MIVDIGPTEEFPEAGKKIMNIGGTEIVVIRSAGQYYAVQNLCPHMGGAIGRGKVSEQPDDHGNPREIITCPFHRWSFDIQTGEATFSTSKRLKTYDVYEEDGRIKLEM